MYILLSPLSILNTICNMSFITQIQYMLSGSYRSSSNPFPVLWQHGSKLANKSFDFTALAIMHLDPSARQASLSHKFKTQSWSILQMAWCSITELGVHWNSILICFREPGANMSSTGSFSFSLLVLSSSYSQQLMPQTLHSCRAASHLSISGCSSW